MNKIHFRTRTMADAQTFFVGPISCRSYTPRRVYYYTRRMDPMQYCCMVFDNEQQASSVNRQFFCGTAKQN